MKRQRNNGGLERVVPAWVLAYALACNQAGAEPPANPDESILWSAPDQGLVLYRGQETNRYEICPRVPGMQRQPFCRTFKAPVLSACGLQDGLQLVLANGDVHQLNSALLGSGGSFEPAHRPVRPLTLVEAWIPGDTQRPGVGLNDVLAVGPRGDLWHFDGEGWLQIAGNQHTRR